MTRNKFTAATKNIVLTGGGTAGHVLPHFALMSEYRKRPNWKIWYVGTNGIEKMLVQKYQVPFHQITGGKLRRYLALANFIDIFKVLIAIIQSFFFLIGKKPAVVFSKGGFVSVPVCLAARILGIPVISHESDLTPGLATRIISKIATKILTTFEDTQKYLPGNSVIHVGSPIRAELLAGSKAKAFDFAQLDPSNQPVLLVLGGSLGSLKINTVLHSILPQLIEKYTIIHITGSDKAMDWNHSRYRSFEYVDKELKDLLAAADLVISRAGANAIFELLALEKPTILIPLVAGSRGDQVVNAEYFQKRNWAVILHEKELTGESLITKLEYLEEKSKDLITSMKQRPRLNSINLIIEHIDNALI